MVLDALRVPIVLAPLAGGPSTPELAAAVSNAGGLGFLAAGYRTPEAFAEALAATQALTDAPIGVNLFSRGGTPADPAEVEHYAEHVRAHAERHGVAAGTARFDDDWFDAKLALVLDAAPTVVSFTFGCPERSVLAAVQAAGSEAWVTVTSPDEARLAAAAGADVLVVQGVEAGGHRGTFADRDGEGEIGLIALLALVRAAVDLPLVATGGIADGHGVAAVLAAGAAAAQLGTAFLRSPEAGTSAVHREALAGSGSTALTRAFSGRLARGIVNAFMVEHPDAPHAYPEVHHLTTPLRAHGREVGDPDVVNLWAGQAHELAGEAPAAEVVAALAAEATIAAQDALRRLEAQRPG